LCRLTEVGFQIRVFQEVGKPFDPEHTSYNKAGLLQVDP
jgi:hypothetical protein